MCIRDRYLGNQCCNTRKLKSGEEEIEQWIEKWSSSKHRKLKKIRRRGPLDCERMGDNEKWTKLRKSDKKNAKKRRTEQKEKWKVHEKKEQKSEKKVAAVHVERWKSRDATRREAKWRSASTGAGDARPARAVAKKVVKSGTFRKVDLFEMRNFGKLDLLEKDRQTFDPS